MRITYSLLLTVGSNISRIASREAMSNFRGYYTKSRLFLYKILGVLTLLDIVTSIRVICLEDRIELQYIVYY